MSIPAPQLGVFLTIAGAALGTYLLRIGGLLLAEHLPSKGPVKHFMDALPGTILLSLVAPGILAEGAWGILAAGTTAFTAYRTRNLFLAMVLGIGIIMVKRHLVIP